VTAAERRAAASARAVRPVKSSAADERHGLLRAGYRVLARNQRRFVTLQELLDESGLSTRAFYRHFETKDQLLVAIYESNATRVEEERAQLIAEAPGPYHALIAWIDSWLTLVYEARRSGRVEVLASSQFLAAEGIDHAIAASHAASRELLQQVLQEGADSGVFRTARPQFDSLALQATVGAIMRQRIDGTLSDPPARTQQTLIDFAERIVGVERAGRRRR